MTWDGWVILFCLFVGALALFIGWALDWTQKELDRQWIADEKAYREAMRRWPP